jgi:hypothetical protein
MNRLTHVMSYCLFSRGFPSDYSNALPHVQAEASMRQQPDVPSRGALRAVTVRPGSSRSPTSSTRSPTISRDRSPTISRDRSSHPDPPRWPHARRLRSERKPIMNTVQDSTPNKEPSAAQKLVGDFGPETCRAHRRGLVWRRLGPTRAGPAGSQSDHVRGVDHQRQHRAASFSSGQSQDQRRDRDRATGGDHPPRLLCWLATSHVGGHGREGGLRRLSPDPSEQLVSRCRTKVSPGARSWMRSGFSTRFGNESGPALNGGKSGASTLPQ